MDVVREKTTTDKVAGWLEQPTIRPKLDALVQQWNELELLGIDLADQLEQMVRQAARKTPDLGLELNEVDWSDLAERYAEEICGVTEDELTRRRIAAGGS